MTRQNMPLLTFQLGPPHQLWGRGPEAGKDGSNDDFPMRQNQECLLSSHVGVALNPPTQQDCFPRFKSTSHVTLMLTIEQHFVALRKQCDWHPIPTPFPIKKQCLCSSPLTFYQSHRSPTTCSVTGYFFFQIQHRWHQGTRKHNQPLCISPIGWSLDCYLLYLVTFWKISHSQNA